MKRLPPPTDEERRTARVAAAALRAAIDNPSAMGERSAMHVDFARPRRSAWYETWSNLPGFVRVNGRRGYYTHDCLPGWTYRQWEIRTEMIPDLDQLAGAGIRPSIATSKAMC